MSHNDTCIEYACVVMRNVRVDQRTGRAAGTVNRLRAAALRIRLKLLPFFAPDTAAPGTSGNTPSSGHCAAVALIVNELLGGELVSATVQGVSHWFNRIHARGQLLDLDLTGDQFQMPAIQVAKAGSLYTDTRVRNLRDVRAETGRRALTLASRARFVNIAHRLGAKYADANQAFPRGRCVHNSMDP